MREKEFLALFESRVISFQELKVNGWERAVRRHSKWIDRKENYHPNYI